MKNAVTRSLYDYWSQLRQGRAAPERTDIEPADIRTILGDTFILETVDRKAYNFRLAGTRLCAAYGRELKGRNLLDFWSGRDRESVACLLAAVVEDAAAAVIGISANNERGQSMPVEVLFLPLHYGGSDFTRILGCFAPMEQPYWLGMHPVIRQPVQSVRLIWPDEKPRFLLRPGADVLALAAASRPLSAAMKATPAISPRQGAIPSRAQGRQIGHLRVITGGRID